MVDEAEEQDRKSRVFWPKVNQLWTKGGKSRRVREVYEDDDGQWHVRYRDADGGAHWVKVESWITWVEKAMHLSGPSPL